VTIGTHSVKDVIVVAVHASFMLIAIVFHREPLSGGERIVDRKKRRTLT
jgi:hypothetical protein